MDKNSSEPIQTFVLELKEECEIRGPFLKVRDIWLRSPMSTLDRENGKVTIIGIRITDEEVAECEAQWRRIRDTVGKDKSEN